MHRILGAQPLEIGPERVAAEQLRIGDIDLVERDIVGGRARLDLFPVNGHSTLPR